MAEIVNLSHSATPKEAIRSIGRRLSISWGAALFTGVTVRRTPDHASGRKDNYGKAFAAYITKHRLGKVMRGAHFVNGPGGNTVGAWVWQVNKKALKAHMDTLCVSNYPF